MPSLSPAEIQALWLSLSIALRAIAFGLPLSIVMAWILSHRQFPGRLLLDLCLHLPLVLPPVVVGYGLLLIFGGQGPIGKMLDQYWGIRIAFTSTGAALASAVMIFPLMVRSVRLSMGHIPIDLEDAARDLGASGWQVFRTITVPLSLPGIVSGAVLAFAAALGEFGAIITFASNIPGETQTLPLAIYSALQSPGGDVMALRLSGISVCVALIALFISEGLNRRIIRAARHR